jgi:hypothetical protein
MRPRCEVCANHRPDHEHPGDRNTVTLRFDAREVRLCVGHARIAEKFGVTTFGGLRELYGSGRRSFVPRRGSDAASAIDERRLIAGRRASDAR